VTKLTPSDVQTYLSQVGSDQVGPQGGIDSPIPSSGDQVMLAPRDVQTHLSQVGIDQADPQGGTDSPTSGRQ
jgi:hypothetical protein